MCIVHQLCVTRRSPLLTDSLRCTRSLPIPARKRLLATLSAMTQDPGSSTEKDIPIDEEFKSTAYARLLQSGERDRLEKEIRGKLTAIGWDDEVRRFCVKLLRERGVENVTLESLVGEVTPVARNNVPAQLREQTEASVRSFLTKELGNK